MKKLLVLFLCASVFWACNHSNHTKEPVVKAAETSHQHEAEKTTLTLNNGQKWDSDESTNRNVADLEAIAPRFEAKGGKTLTDYTAFAGEFSTSLDKLVKECRMKGPDHDALHLWLEPVMKKTASLKKAGGEQEASELFHSISEQLHLYHQYFE